MVVDVIHAVAVVAVAAGAVAEFQLRVGHVGSAADGTAVGIGGFYLCSAGLIRTGIREGDDLGT